jgi:hypothetical protein
VTELQRERDRRGLPPYRTVPQCPRVLHRPSGKRGQLDAAHRGQLRTMLARMVADDPMVTNPTVAEAFYRATGQQLSRTTVRDHRIDMGLPAAPFGGNSNRNTGR